MREKSDKYTIREELTYYQNLLEEAEKRYEFLEIKEKIRVRCNKLRKIK
jgi:hypothetical protein